ncbi:polysaccharide deacetylase family protein [Paracoccus sp. (in: a-proteobacteria)]|uniref:polysaccharide deacetylase family protein n=1 Tax=Paracoccus sp. TaxID=267 RepID=UPI00289ADB64|nr:polysaccharide deacetylase family protein [Paracoccus sp. (in: a-proteobacteria)]
MHKAIDLEGIEPGWRGRLRRRWSRFCRAERLGLLPEGFHLSISFDDVPDSAATIGKEVLDHFGCRASWYVATGLLGAVGPSGQVLDGPRLRELDQEGHEIALHGHRHANMAMMPWPDVKADLARNRDILAQIMGQPASPHLAYPYGEARCGLKARLRGEVLSARGIAPQINLPTSDRMQLCAFDLRLETGRIERAIAAMQRAALTGGWVILFSHDVRPDPSAYGITPDVLHDLLSVARELGAVIRPVGEVFAQIKR